jgi:hypothetical protein
MNRRSFLFGGIAALAAPALVSIAPKVAPEWIGRVEAIRAAREAIVADITEGVDILATRSPQWHYFARATVDGVEWCYAEVFEGQPNERQIEIGRKLAIKAIQTSAEYRRRGVG